MTGGRRRPAGVVTGLALSFTFATVALVYVVDALGLPGGLLRTLAIVVLLVFGLALIVPRIAARLEAWLTRLAPARAARGGGRFGPGPLGRAGPRLVYPPRARAVLPRGVTPPAAP